MAIQEDILITKKFNVDASSPVKGLTKSTSTFGYQFPNTIRDEHFYTIFRISKRDVNFSSRRLEVSSGNKEAEIVLPLPPNLSTAYGANYTNADLGVGGALLGGAVGAAAQSFGQSGNALTAAGAGADVVYQATLGQAVNAFSQADGTLSGIGAFLGEVGKGLGTFAARSAINSPIGAGIGVANNPYEAIIYQNPEFRTHSFQYNLFARNPSESATILNIVQQFKLAMHPEFDDSGLFFNYPRVVDIEYVAGSEDNPYLHKISTSALTQFTVNYHGDGTPSYFNTGDENPAPTNVQINMTFQELNFHTRDDIEGKYY